MKVSSAAILLGVLRVNKVSPYCQSFSSTDCILYGSGDSSDCKLTFISGVSTSCKSNVSGIATEVGGVVSFWKSDGCLGVSCTSFSICTYSSVINIIKTVDELLQWNFSGSNTFG